MTRGSEAGMIGGTMSADTDHVVLDYLDEVADEAQRRRMHPSERTKFIADLRRRIDREREGKRDDPEVVRAILARLGGPTEQVARAMAGSRAGFAPAASMPDSAPGATVTATAAPVVTARRERVRERVLSHRPPKLHPVVTLAIALLGVLLLVMWLGWLGYAIAWLFGWSLPRTSYGVRVVALLWLPAVLLAVMSVIGALTEWDYVMQFIYPLTAGLLGACFLVWGSVRRGPGA
jgi:hypothetical protein